MKEDLDKEYRYFSQAVVIRIEEQQRTQEDLLKMQEALLRKVVDFCLLVYIYDFHGHVFCFSFFLLAPDSRESIEA